MPEPVGIHPDIGHANERTRWATKHFTRNQIFDGSPVAVYAQVEVQNFSPHGGKKNQVPLLSGVFLSDLQFDSLISLCQSAKERGHRFASLEIDGTILDLDDDVVVELSIQRVKNIVGCPSAVILGIAPIKMMVVNERTIKKNPSMRFQRS